MPAQVQAQLVTETIKTIAPTTDTPEHYEVEPDLVSAPAEPERVIRDAPTERETIAAHRSPTEATSTPVGFAEVPQRAPRNDLERDLFARLEAARQKGATA